MFVCLILLIAIFICNFNGNSLISVNGLGIVGIDSIYTIVDVASGNLFVFENGRAFIIRDNEVFGKLDELCSGDQVIDFRKTSNSSYLILVKNCQSEYLTLRSIDVKEDSIVKRWDLDVEGSKDSIFTRLFVTKEKYYFALNNSLLVIHASDGILLKDETLSISDDKSLIHVVFGNDEIVKSIVVLDSNNNSIVFYELDNKIGISDTNPQYIIPFKNNFNIYPNSCLITNKGNINILNLLYTDKKNGRLWLLKYNFDNRTIDHIDTKLDISLFNDKFISILNNELTLRLIRNSDLIITFSRYDNTPNKHVIYILEEKQSFILKSFRPAFDNIQSSSLNIFIDENNLAGENDYLSIINYDNNNNLSITNIFDYKKSITENKIFRNTLKLDYINKEEIIYHGSIEYSALTNKGDLIIQFTDSLLVIISLNCDISKKSCIRPRVTDIYESFISTADNQKYYDNNFIVYSNNIYERSNKMDLAHYSHSSFVVSANNIYYDSLVQESTSNKSYFSGTVLIIVNRHYSVFGYLIEENRLIWRNDAIKHHIKEGNSITKLRQLIVGNKETPILLIVVNEQSLFKINIHSGSMIVDTLDFGQPSKIIVTSSLNSTGEQLSDPRFIIIDENDNFIKILDLNNFESGSDEIMSKDLVHYYITYNKSVINGYMLDSMLKTSLKWRYNLENEIIENITTSKCQNGINFPSIVSKEYDIINRFDYPALLGLLTNKKKIMIFNSINGNLIHSEILPESFASPFTLGIYHNLIVLTAFHTHHQIPVFLVIELYQFPPENYKASNLPLYEKLKFLFSSDKNIEESKIYPERSIHIQKTSFLYNYELPITILTTSNTMKSITPKTILVGSESSNVIESIPEKLFTTLRPNSNKYFENNYIENVDFPPYKPVIDQRVKYAMKFSGPKKIFVVPDIKFESTSIFISIGFNYIEIQKFYPATSFDKIPENFNKLNIIFTVLIIMFTTALGLIYVKKKHKNWE